MYYTFTVKDKEYKLRLNTKNVVELEKKLGCNPLGIFGNGERIPTVTEMVTVLHQAMQQLEHGITLNDAYTIFDNYIEDGNTATDFIPVIVDIYKVSGIIKDEDNEKN